MTGREETVRVTDDQIRGFIERAAGHGAVGAESLLVIFRHLLNEEYRAGVEHATDLLTASRESSL